MNPQKGQDITWSTLWQFPGISVVGDDEAIGSLVVEGVMLIVVGEGVSCAGSDVTQMGYLGTECSVLNGAGCVEMP